MAQRKEYDKKGDNKGKLNAGILNRVLKKHEERFMSIDNEHLSVFGCKNSENP